MTSVSNGDLARTISSSEQSTCPVAQVPPEILTVIFLLHQSVCRESKKEFQPWDEEPQWISVAQVCQAWRETALCCPELWSSIEVPGRRNRSTAFQDMQVERSQGRLLTVQAFFLHSAKMEVKEHAIETVVSLIPRLKALKLVANEYWALKALMDRFKSSPEPTSLTVNSSDNDSPSSLSNGGAPGLQVLPLAGGMQMPKSVYSNVLAHVRLGEYPSNSPWPWPKLCDILRPLQKTLKTLALAVSLKDVPTSFERHPPLHFSQLEELALYQPPAVICRLLGCIRLPVSTRLYLRNVEFHEVDTRAFRKFLSAVSTFRLLATPPQLSQLSLNVNFEQSSPVGRIAIKGWIHDKPMGLDRDWHVLTEPPSIILEHRYTFIDEINSVLSLSIDEGQWGILGYSISELEKLELMVGVGRQRGPRFLWDTLAQLSKLKNIRILKSVPLRIMFCLAQDSEAIRRIMEGNLKDVSSENSDPPKSHLPQPERRFASLRSITFGNIKFNRRPDDDPSTIGQLLCNLRLRHELGCPLERLVFWDCQGVQAAELEEFAQYVSEVENLPAEA